MAHPIKKELNNIIVRYYSGQISYPRARKEIEDTVDQEFEQKKLASEFTYNDLIALAAERRNAYARLERRKKNLDRFAKGF